jgi:hypothetical protein
MPLEMQDWVDPQLAQTYWKLARQAGTHEEWQLAWQALQQPRMLDREYLWEYVYPPYLIPVTCEEEEKWEQMCKECDEKQKKLPPPLKLLGPPPSINAVLGMALHQSDTKKRKEKSKGSYPAVGLKKARLSPP